MPKTPPPPPALPSPEVFRAWMQASLPALGLTPSGLGARLDLGRNTLRDFLVQPGRDIRLGTASAVVAHLSQEAQSQGKILPDLDLPALGVSNG